MTSPYLLADLRKDEGLRTTAYPDPLSGCAPWTIGYGHTGPEVRPGLTWTDDQCEAALAGDVARACRALDQQIPWWRKLDDIRQDVLANMAFNLGVGKLMGFVHTLKFIHDGDWERASEAMLASVWATQVGARAQRLAEQMRTGVRA